MFSSFLSFITSFIIGFIGIGIIVFLHELGHFFAARLFKIDVEVLQFGMGPKIYSLMGRKTEFRISIIPFGGSCKMKGSLDLIKALKDDVKEFKTTEAGSYFSTTPLKRFFIFLAGPVANILISAILLIIVSMFPTERVSDEARILLASDYQSIYNTTITQDELKTGDKILTLDGKEIIDYQEMQSILSVTTKKISAIIERDGKYKEVTLTPHKLNDGYIFGISLYQEPIIGRVIEGSDFLVDDNIVKVNGHDIYNTNDFYTFAKAEDTNTIEVLRGNEIHTLTLGNMQTYPFAWKSDIRIDQNKNIFAALSSGIEKVKELIITTLQSIFSIFTNDAEDTRQELSGPTRAAQSIGQITTLAFHTSTISGFRSLMYLLSIVSISIAVINFLPLPSFDGGQMVVNLIELVFRKQFKPKTYVIWQIIGILVVVAILVGMYSLDIKYYFFN